MNILIHDYAGHPFPPELSRALAVRGYQVTHAFADNLLTPRGELVRKSTDAASLVFRPVPMSPRYRTDKYSFLKRLKHEHAYGKELTKLVRDLRPDLVMSGQTPSEPHWRMVKAARSLGIPVVSWVQDFYSVAVAKLARKKLPVVGALAGAWYQRLDALGLRHSSGVVAITEDFRPRLRALGVAESRITVIPNWAPLADLPPQPRANPWAQREGLTDTGGQGSFVFLYSGTLAMKHNPDLLVALAQHFTGDPAMRVVVISEGPGADYLARCKAAGGLDNLVLRPFQPFAAMPEVLASGDVLLAVLENDAGVFSVPSKVLTYHTVRRPILASIPAANLAARILREEGSGLVVEPGDTAAWLAAAQKLRDDATLRATLANKARAYAEREFDIDRITDRFEQVFRRARAARAR